MSSHSTSIYLIASGKPGRSTSFERNTPRTCRVLSFHLIDEKDSACFGNLSKAISTSPQEERSLLETEPPSFTPMPVPWMVADNSGVTPLAIAYVVLSCA